jgi:hypothetical protein
MVNKELIISRFHENGAISARKHAEIYCAQSKASASVRKRSQNCNTKLSETAVS